MRAVLPGAALAHQHGHLRGEAFYGGTPAIAGIKQAAFNRVYSRHPHRFVIGALRAAALSANVSINPLPASAVILPHAHASNEMANSPKPI